MTYDMLRAFVEAVIAREISPRLRRQRPGARITNLSFYRGGDVEFAWSEP